MTEIDLTLTTADLALTGVVRAEGLEFALAGTARVLCPEGASTHALTLAAGGEVELACTEVFTGDDGCASTGPTVPGCEK